MGKLAPTGRNVAQTLRRRTVESIEKNIQRDKTPPYIGLFRERLSLSANR